MEKKILEKDIQRTICDYLQVKGYFFWRSNNVPVFHEGKFRALPKYTPRGLPDIMILLEGEFIGIEVKRPKAKLRPEQALFGARLVENGGTYLIARSLEDIQSFL